MTALPPEFEGRYKCPVCKRGYPTLPAKKTHVKLKHDAKPPTGRAAKRKGRKS